MKQNRLGRQTSYMCVSVDSSHENCSYHVHKYSCKFNGIQRPFLFYMNFQVAFIFGVDLYSPKYGYNYTIKPEAAVYVKNIQSGYFFTYTYTYIDISVHSRALHHDFTVSENYSHSTVCDCEYGFR